MTTAAAFAIAAASAAPLNDPQQHPQLGRAAPSLWPQSQPTAFGRKVAGDQNEQEFLWMMQEEEGSNAAAAAAEQLSSTLLTHSERRRRTEEERGVRGEAAFLNSSKGAHVRQEGQ